MALRLIVNLQALPGKIDAMIMTYASLCPKVRQEPGCDHFEIFQNTERPDDFILLETWSDQESLTAHSKLLAERGLNVESIRKRTAEPEQYSI